MLWMCAGLRVAFRMKRTVARKHSFAGRGPSLSLRMTRGAVVGRRSSVVGQVKGRGHCGLKSLLSGCVVLSLGGPSTAAVPLCGTASAQDDPSLITLKSERFVCG